MGVENGRDGITEQRPNFHFFCMALLFYLMLNGQLVHIWEGKYM